MKVTLVHNPGAGAGGSEPTDLARLIRDAGHELVVQSCRDPGWAEVLDTPCDLVAILGGDGTISSVAKRMVGRGIPLAALAAGTANNIALTLGTVDVPIDAQVNGWSTGRRLPFDVCVARGPWGAEHLIEGIGCGLFAWGMREADANGERREQPPEARLARVLAMLHERVGAQPTTRIEARLDGDDISGDYVLLEAMNTMFVGPNLFLAAGGHPGDGMLDIVTVDDAARDSFRAQLASWRRGALQAPAWPVRQGRHLSMRWTGFPLHLDDRLWPEAPVDASDDLLLIDLTVEQAALEFLVPEDTDHPPVP